ncbi:MAG: bifunctional transcriptional activator/DNA repair enzyme protein Ada [Gammaproteobacteria bacterium]|nr:MAG: bifunctional transcriptional activator/DNA repair enzyme protein Ada [Gammaproteobacteria bacterium]
MRFTLPDRDTLYTALIERDPRYEGRVFVCVQSTGIFCRLSCPARKPKPENCLFVETVAECLEAGFRPCKRCHPLKGADDTTERLLAALDERPAHRWQESDVAALGIDPSTARRSFKRAFGITFLEMARLRRIGAGFTSLSDGENVIDAQQSAGFASASAFRNAFARLAGQSPGQFSGADAPLRADWIDTVLGAMVVVTDEHSIHLLEFADRRALPGELKRLLKTSKGQLGFGRFDINQQLEAELSAYFAASAARFTVPLSYHGSAFTSRVWDALREIPPGETRSYSDLARQLGNPGASRAVARANAANQIAIIIPCHRVIGSDGSLVGYGGGLWRKRRLIEIERELVGRRNGES